MDCFDLHPIIEITNSTNPTTTKTISNGPALSV